MRIAIIGMAHSGKTSLLHALHREVTHNGNIVKIIKFADPIYNTLDVLKRSKHRLFMQDYGDLVKKHFGEMFFVDYFKRIILETDSLRPRVFLPNDYIFCDDVRRTYEFDAVKEMGFVTIYSDCDDEIRRRRAEEVGMTLNDQHNSENEVKTLKEKCDVVVDNSCPIGKLRNIAQSVLRGLKFDQRKASDTYYKFQN